MLIIKKKKKMVRYKYNNVKIIYFIFIIIFILSFFLFKRKERDFFIKTKSVYILDSNYSWDIDKKSNYLSRKYKSTFKTISFDFNGYASFKDSILFLSDSENESYVGFFNFNNSMLKKNYFLFEKSEAVRFFMKDNNGNYYFLRKSIDPFDYESYYTYIFSIEKGLISEAKYNLYSKDFDEITGDKKLIRNNAIKIHLELLKMPKLAH